MALLNAVTSAPRNVTARALLRAELGRVGFDDYVETLLTLSDTLSEKAMTTNMTTDMTNDMPINADQQKALMLLINQAMSYQMSGKRDLVELDASFDETSFDHVFNRYVMTLIVTQQVRWYSLHSIHVFNTQQASARRGHDGRRTRPRAHNRGPRSVASGLGRRWCGRWCGRWCNR